MPHSRGQRCLYLTVELDEPVIANFKLIGIIHSSFVVWGQHQSKELYRNFNEISVRRFILSGAPFTVKAGHYGAGFDASLNETLRKRLLRAEDADFLRADHHAIDEQVQ